MLGTKLELRAYIKLLQNQHKPLWFTTTFGSFQIQLN